MTDLIDTVREWIGLDPDPATRAELEALVAADDLDSLASLFDGRLEFGTAGLRAALGPGPLRMNSLVVRQTTAGLMSWLVDQGLDAPTVVVGFDARHGSAQFARDTAGVIGAGGGRALLLPQPLPTPVLARAVLSQGADAGIMITASHNPPADNGYKLYLGDGIQLVAPADREIAGHIGVIAQRGEPIEIGMGGVETLGPEVADEHLTAIQAVLLTDHRSVRSVYTAMHGVAGDHLLAAFERAGFPAPSVVDSQFAPDPDFPTVAFPNPEEPGALDLALELAARQSADVVLANDPDGDRLALAVPSRDGPGFVAVSGDQLGVLLADHLLSHTAGAGRLVAKSLVSSRLLDAMADAAGVMCVTTLTGFKWVARPLVEHPDQRYLLGYEEAIGYSVGGIVRDKDGISAALVAAEMVAEGRASGRTVWDQLDRLATAHGTYLTAPVSVRFDGDDAQHLMDETMSRVLAAPLSELTGSPLVSAEDLGDGRRLPPTAGLVLLYADHTQVIVRPSGTEPKIKAYVEVIEPVADGSDVEASRRRAEDHLARARTEVAAVLER
ncbi:MAG: phospho-sugar mutase [Actinomycetia bacterium]|nr:phospho-sugar mutase [Actinomycetes bacterium]